MRDFHFHFLAVSSINNATTEHLKIVVFKVFWGIKLETFCFLVYIFLIFQNYFSICCLIKIAYLSVGVLRVHFYGLKAIKCLESL